MYNSIGQQKLKDTLELVRIAYSSSNQETFREDILNTLVKTLNIDKAIFILRDKDSKYTDFVTKNIEEQYVRSFKEYYHQYDPFNLISGKIKKNTVHLKQLISYPVFLHSEYYNDFLRPQQIYHKIMVCLGRKERMQGMITLFKPRKSQDFTAEEISMLNVISPYIYDALCGIKLRKEAELEKTVFEAIEMSTSNSVLVFDASMGLLYMNKKAEELCRTLNKDNSVAKAPFIPEVLLEDCRTMRNKMKEHHSGTSVPVRSKSINDFSPKNLFIRSQLFKNQAISGVQPFFVVSIEEQNECRLINEMLLKEVYGLTAREIQIVERISEGLKNSEIAQRLFIAEITVKKHIQNIFAKVGVANRSALVNKALR